MTTRKAHAAQAPEEAAEPVEAVAEEEVPEAPVEAETEEAPDEVETVSEVPSDLGVPVPADSVAARGWTVQQGGGELIADFVPTQDYVNDPPARVEFASEADERY